MSVNVSLNLDYGEISRMLNSPRGVVGTYIYRLALETAAEARTRVPVKTNKLRSSIGVSRGPRNSMFVTANRSYALAVHEGSSEHDIVGKPVLAFPSKKRGGKMIVVKKVHMPAHKGNPFLVSSLKHVISRHR